MAITLGRNSGYGWVCHVFSRASELTIRWYADIIFIHTLLRTISEEVGIDPSVIKIRWHMVSTYQSITSMPWFLVLTGRESILEDGLAKLPADAKPGDNWHHATLIRYRRVYLGDDYQSFRVQKRPATAYRIHKGLLPQKDPVWTHELTIPRAEINFEVGGDDDDE